MQKGALQGTVAHLMGLVLSVEETPGAPCPCAARDTLRTLLPRGPPGSSPYDCEKSIFVASGAACLCALLWMSEWAVRRGRQTGVGGGRQEGLRTLGWAP